MQIGTAALHDQRRLSRRLRSLAALAGRWVLPLASLGLASCGGVLDPQGPVGESEKTILIDSLAIMLAIVVPTIVVTLGFAWWYRASNIKALQPCAG